MSRFKLNFFKPYQGKGALAAFEARPSENGFAIFLSMLPEMASGESKFDRNAKISAKLGLPDIGEILAVLQGTKPAAGTVGKDGKSASLFHKNPTGSAVITFNVKEKGGGYFLGLSKQEGSTLKGRYSISITDGEATILERFLNRVADELLVDDWAPANAGSESKEGVPI